MTSLGKNKEIERERNTNQFKIGRLGSLFLKDVEGIEEEPLINRCELACRGLNDLLANKSSKECSLNMVIYNDKEKRFFRYI